MVIPRIIPRRTGRNTRTTAAGRGDAARSIGRKPTQGGHAAMRLPRVLSPQMHRRVDLVALPSVIASVVWMSRRNSRVAALMSLTAAGEGAEPLPPDQPPGFVWRMRLPPHQLGATWHGGLSPWA